MGRLQEFDEATVLTAAMHAFRRLGYGGVSIKILEAETGLSSGSLYNSFGGKDGIFERAMAHYNDTVVDKRIREHLTGRPPLAGLVALFESLLDEPDDQAFGCLLSNASIEFAGQEALAAPGIRSGFDRFLAAFAASLRGTPGRDEDEVARLSLRLLTYYQGLLVLIRHGYEKAALRRTIKAELQAILGDEGS